MSVTSQDKINSSFAAFLFIKAGKGQNKFIAVHGLKLEIGNWKEQYKSMKAEFPISNFNAPLCLSTYLISTEKSIIFFRRYFSGQEIILHFIITLDIALTVNIYQYLLCFGDK